MNYHDENQKCMPGWQIAYAARELRHKKTVTLSCLKSERALVIEQMNSFSYKRPIITHTIEIPDSKEIYLEITN